MTQKQENVRKIVTGYRDDYRTGFLLDYPSFKENYKLTAIDLSKEQALDADPKAIQINFIGNLNQGGSITVFILEEVNCKFASQITICLPS